VNTENAIHMTTLISAAVNRPLLFRDISLYVLIKELISDFVLCRL